MLEELIDGEPHTLRSFSPWEPGRLAEANYIDAMSPLRRQELRELGGYTEDPRLLGWEDYDLWVPDRAACTCRDPRAEILGSIPASGALDAVLDNECRHVGRAVPPAVSLSAVHRA